MFYIHNNIFRPISWPSPGSPTVPFMLNTVRDIKFPSYYLIILEVPIRKCERKFTDIIKFGSYVHQDNWTGDDAMTTWNDKASKTCKSNL